MTKQNQMQDEGFHRLKIFEEYINTDFYLNHFQNATNEINRINKRFKIIPGDEKAKSYASKIISRLNTITGIPHKYVYNKKSNRINIKSPQTNYDYPPIEFKSKRQPKHTLLLQFDLKRGIKEQIYSAEKKLKNKQRALKHLAFKPIPTTRMNVKKIAENMSILTFREWTYKKEKMTWTKTAEELKMPVSSAKSKAQKARKLVISGEIQRYFPSFSD